MNNLMSDTERGTSWNQGVDLLESAFTRGEIEAARAAVLAHLAQFPDDEQRDPWHGWGNKIAYLEQREEQARVLGLSSAEHAERERLLKNARIVTDPASEPDALQRLSRARAPLLRWLRRHPADPAVAAQLGTLDREMALARQIQDALRIAGAAEPLATAI